MILAWHQSMAQNQVDALRYSQTYAGGTARSTAMAGAFGSLGGDFASVSQNPAGLGVYRSSEFTITPELYYGNISSKYNGSTYSDYKYNLNFNNLGYVSAFGNGKKGFIGGAFAIGFNRINNFNNNIKIEGLNSASSLGQVYVESANAGDGYNPDGINDLDAFSEWLFYDSEVMKMDNNGYYYLDSALLDDGGQPNNLQRNILQHSGRMSEWIFSLGFNYGHFFYFGGTFGIIPVDFNEISAYSEYDNDNYTREYFRYYETLSVQGTGYTGKFGIILKPVSFLRFGLAAHLPTSFYLTEEYDASMRSLFVSGTVNPVDEYNDPIDASVYDYEIITPAKFIGSLGFSIAKSMIISTDLEYIDYASMRLRNGGDGYDFDEENRVIKNIYRKNINVKSGVELRLDKLYLRGGFAYYGSPYQQDEANYDANSFYYSGGFGFRTEHTFIDLSLSYMTHSERLMLYQVPSQARAVSAELDQNTLRTMMTFGFKF